MKFRKIFFYTKKNWCKKGTLGLLYKLPDIFSRNFFPIFSVKLAKLDNSELGLIITRWKYLDCSHEIHFQLIKRQIQILTKQKTKDEQNKIVKILYDFEGNNKKSGWTFSNPSFGVAKIFKLYIILWDKIACPHRKLFGLFYPLETCFFAKSFQP